MQYRYEKTKRIGKYADVLTIIDETLGLINNIMGDNFNPANTNDDSQCFNTKFAKSICLMSEAFSETANSRWFTFTLLSYTKSLISCVLNINGEQEINNYVHPIPRNIEDDNTFKLSVAYFYFLRLLNTKGGEDYLLLLPQDFKNLFRESSGELSKKLVYYLKNVDCETKCEKLLDFIPEHLSELKTTLISQLLDDDIANNSDDDYYDACEFQSEEKDEHNKEKEHSNKQVIKLNEHLNDDISGDSDDNYHDACGSQYDEDLETSRKTTAFYNFQIIILSSPIIPYLCAIAFIIGVALAVIACGVGIVAGVTLTIAAVSTMTYRFFAGPVQFPSKSTTQEPEPPSCLRGRQI